LWPAHSTDLNPCDFYLWSILKIKCMWIILIHYENWKKTFGR
jgi:hypothetical protein